MRHVNIYVLSIVYLFKCGWTCTSNFQNMLPVYIVYVIEPSIHAQSLCTTMHFQKYKRVRGEHSDLWNKIRWNCVFQQDASQPSHTLIDDGFIKRWTINLRGLSGKC